QLGGLGVEAVDAGFADLDGRVAIEHRDDVLALRSGRFGFDHGFAGEELEAGIGEAAAEHADAAILAEAEEGAGAEQDLGAAVRRAELGVVLHLLEGGDLYFDGLAVELDRAFDVMNEPGAGGDDLLRESGAGAEQRNETEAPPIHGPH